MRLISLVLLYLCYLDRTEAFSVSPLPTIKNAWQFQGHDVYSQVTKPSSPNKNKPAVLLIHGFGCSTTYWRETIAVLTESGYEVHSLDLLGQGASAKPGRADGVEYSIPLWAAQCNAYAHENIDAKEVVLMGNSLGSLVALSAATEDFAESVPREEGGPPQGLKERVKGIGMFNCGIGLNSSGIAKEPQWNPFQRFLISILFKTLNAVLFENPVVLSYVLNEVVTRELLSNTLQSLYIKNPDRVDEELVESFYAPAKEEGAVEALSQIYTNDPGATPMDLHEKHADYLQELPIHLVWGENDAVTPIGGGVGSYYINLADDSETMVTLDRIPDCGHVPFDDHHVESNQAMLEWLESVSA